MKKVKKSKIDELEERLLLYINYNKHFENKNYVEKHIIDDIIKELKQELRSEKIKTLKWDEK